MSKKADNAAPVEHPEVWHDKRPVMVAMNDGTEQKGVIKIIDWEWFDDGEGEEYPIFAIDMDSGKRLFPFSDLKDDWDQVFLESKDEQTNQQ